MALTLSVATSAPSSEVETTSTPPTTTRAPRTTTPAPTSTRTTRPPPIWLGSSDGDVEDSSPSSQATNDSSPPCTADEIKDMLLEFVIAANTPPCKPYSTVTPRSVNITASCTSQCRMVELWLNLAYAMPDCYYAYENQNKKKTVGKEMDKCFPTTASSASTFVSFEIVSKNVLPTPPPSMIAPGTRPPPKASASAWKSGTWLAGALLGLTVVVAW